jgi:endo-alpha-1,4-polygalactosaminidase (GH114 family)
VRRLLLPLAALLVVALAAPVAAAPPRPEPTDRMQWQLADLPADLTVDADVYDLDLFETTRAQVRQLHDDGRFVVCYLSAGSWEPYRPDARRFPASVLGRPLEGWEDERWLDIRRLDVLLPILEARLDLCARKGFDGVEFDNVDGWTNRTGFPLTRRNQFVFLRRLANEAKERGLSPGLKNALGLIPALVGHYGWALDEQCLEYRECRAYRPFVEAGKAVFIVEYEGRVADLCGREPRGTQLSRKRLRLDAWVARCPYRPPV